MYLDEVETKEEMVAALKRGDADLEREIQRAVSQKVLGAEVTAEWELGMEQEELTMMIEDVESLRYCLGTYAATELEGLPAATIEGALQHEVNLAAEATSGDAHQARNLFSFVSGQGPGPTLRPVHHELHLSMDAPLSWVPEKKMLEVLLAEGPRDADWTAPEAEGDSYMSGWYESGDYWRLEPNCDLAQEWAYDVRQEYLSEMVDADPAEAIAAFMGVLTTIHPTLAKKVKKAKLPKDLLADYAVAYFSDPERGMEIIAEAMGEWGYQGSRGNIMLELDRAALQALGIREGKWWDGAPWQLVDLPAAELAYEGTLMRHCVGRFDFGYRSAVEAGTTRIWSLRSRHNKPVLTFEVDAERWRNAGEWPAERGGAIEQLKGKLNRAPGEHDLQERAVLHWIFARLDIDPAHVPDLGWRLDNPGFNAPWRSYQERAHGRLLRY